MVRRCHTTDLGTARIVFNRFGLARIAEHPTCVCRALYYQHSSTAVLLNDSPTFLRGNFGSSTVATITGNPARIGMPVRLILQPIGPTAISAT